MLDDSFRKENRGCVLKISIIQLFHRISEDVLKGRGKPVEGVSDHHHSRACQQSLLSWKYGSVFPRHVVVVFQIHGKEMINTD